MQDRDHPAGEAITRDASGAIVIRLTFQSALRAIVNSKFHIPQLAGEAPFGANRIDWIETEAHLLGNSTLQHQSDLKNSNTASCS
jgi:hypothetical protein